MVCRYYTVLALWWRWNVLLFILYFIYPGSESACGKDAGIPLLILLRTVEERAY